MFKILLCLAMLWLAHPWCAAQDLLFKGLQAGTKKSLIEDYLEKLDPLDYSSREKIVFKTRLPGATEDSQVFPGFWGLADGPLFAVGVSTPDETGGFYSHWEALLTRTHGQPRDANYRGLQIKLWCFAGGENIKLGYVKQEKIASMRFETTRYSDAPKRRVQDICAGVSLSTNFEGNLLTIRSRDRREEAAAKAAAVAAAQQTKPRDQACLLCNVVEAKYLGLWLVGTIMYNYDETPEKRGIEAFGRVKIVDIGREGRAIRWMREDNKDSGWDAATNFYTEQSYREFQRIYRRTGRALSKEDEGCLSLGLRSVSSTSSVCTQRSDFVNSTGGYNCLKSEERTSWGEARVVRNSCSRPLTFNVVCQGKVLFPQITLEPSTSRDIAYPPDGKCGFETAVEVK